MIAVRSNERAAAGLGITSSGIKLYAFGIRRPGLRVSAVC